MNGPVGRLGPRNEKNAPAAPASIPKNAANKSIRCIWSVSRYAAAAGVINMADTSTTPTACSEITTAKASSSISA